MPTDSSKPLDGIAPESVTAEDVDEAAVRTALSSSNPMVRQRGAEVCETLAEEDVDTVRPFLDDVASLACDGNAAIALRAIAVLDAVVGRDPAALEGRLSDLVGAAASDIVDVQLTAATALGELVVERPDLVAPYAQRLIEAVRATEPDREIRDFSDVVGDRVTQRTLQEHEEAERRRRVSGRRTLINVVVAVAEEEPESAFDADERSRSDSETQPPDVVADLVTLLDDVDPSVSGGAIDALGQLATVNPGVVAPVSDRLIDCLDHDATVVRARAVRALGHLGDDAAVSKLRTVAEADPDEDVREIAEETANFLAGTS